VVYGGLAVMLLVRPRAPTELAAFLKYCILAAIGGEDVVAAQPEAVLDDDVAQAAAEAMAMQSGDAAILIKKLVKIFDATSNGKRIVKLAVDELCLAVETGEVFGLLSHRP
jgi:hypothetical protein